MTGTLNVFNFYGRYSIVVVNIVIVTKMQPDETANIMNMQHNHYQHTDSTTSAKKKNWTTFTTKPADLVMQLNNSDNARRLHRHN